MVGRIIRAVVEVALLENLEAVYDRQQSREEYRGSNKRHGDFRVENKAVGSVQSGSLENALLDGGESRGQQHDADSDVLPDKQQVNRQNRVALRKHAPPDKHYAGGGNNHR